SQHPGQLWLVGNEIERRDWKTSTGHTGAQQEILPEVYARAYHEIYYAIKSVDPTAKVSNGSIILPSPLRLEYMSRIWDEYKRLYHEPWPVDVWQIHLYLIREKRYETGAGIPAGIEAASGLFADLVDPELTLLNKDFSHVPGLIRAFRVWMKEHGQQDKPLIITEMAVLMPDWIMPGEFTASAIRNEFLYPTLDYIFNIKDPDLGMPNDDNRLVQTMFWWSFDKDYGYYDNNTFRQAYNGNLVWSGLGPPDNAPNPQGISELGQYWANYVANVPDDVNLQPVVAHPAAVISKSGDPVSVEVKLTIANSGNVDVTQPFSVLFQQESSGAFLASSEFSGRVRGCGAETTMSANIPNLAPGLHSIRVIVDNYDDIPEMNNGDNALVFTVLVAGHELRLPFIIRR
ncbi:MAG: hypothetical protein P1S60_13450, partial [Anaerolineae bacterium]|nr:hypothetical protein [Anaerolineae bacterium]